MDGEGFRCPLIQRGNLTDEKIEVLPICEDIVVDLEKFLRMCEEEELKNTNVKDKTSTLLELALKSPIKNLVVTHSPSIETDNIFSGEVEKYYFDNPANVSLKNNELIISEENTNESLYFDTSKIEGISPVSKNDSLVFHQENVCAMQYDGGQIITFYFD